MRADYSEDVPLADSTEGYFGRKEKIPIIAPATTSKAGLILYWSRISRVPTARAPVSNPVIAPFAMVKPPASKRPIETGARPS